MFRNIGIIGTGNMGSATARAVAQATEDRSRIFLANRTMEKAKALAEEIDCAAVTNEEIAGKCDLIFLAVKPQMMREMLAGLKSVFAQREKGSFVLVSMAAGLSCADIREMSGTDAHIIRMMPNTPVSIGKGVVEYCGLDASEEELSSFAELLSPAGTVDRIPEKLMDAASAVSGCGPAYVYLFIEALADGGVACGLSRKQAMLYAAGMVRGAAEMVLQSGKHPGELKDAVCSPGGTTIEGVRVLEENGFRGTVMDAVIAADEKSSALRG